LDEVFRHFDNICKQNGVLKIETVGKTYMACGGLKFVEERLSDDLKKYSNVKRTLDLAIGMMKFIDKFTYDAGKRLEIKIGIHHGNCIFGVLGYHKPQFSLIGDTVNTTSRCCTTGPNGKIILSEQAFQALEKFDELTSYKFAEKIVEMKGKGDKLTYILQRDEPNSKKDRRLGMATPKIPNSKLLAVKK
jgi:class 3 adenylate cyclase